MLSQSYHHHTSEHLHIMKSQAAHVYHEPYDISPAKVSGHYSLSPNSVALQPHPHNYAAPSHKPAEDHNNVHKFRQLPCRTFISVGTCPYRERCVYLHDPRIICRSAKTKTRRKNREDSVLDSLFWPIMPYQVVCQKLDSTKQPHVIQNYDVPALIPGAPVHDQAVFSMWMHFVDFCQSCGDSYSLPVEPLQGGLNVFTGKERLRVFQQLARGESVSTGGVWEGEECGLESISEEDSFWGERVLRDGKCLSPPVIYEGEVEESKWGVKEHRHSPDTSALMWGPGEGLGKGVWSGLLVHQPVTH